LTLADKIAGDQELQMLVNSGAHDKLQKLQDDKAKNLATQATQTSRIADQKQRRKNPIDFESEKEAMSQFEL
jgi:Holliday junction resolvasome RuvABC ATP-dependent DNA helicase subunit